MSEADRSTPARQARIYDSMSVAPTAAAYGIGPAWIGESLYWSDGVNYTISSRRIDEAIIGSSFDNSNSDSSNYRFLNSAGWTNLSSGTGTPIWDGTNSLGVYKFGTVGEQIRLGNTTSGVLGTVTHKRRLLPYVMDMTNVETFTMWVYVDGSIVENTYNAGTGLQIQLAFYDAAIANATQILLNGSACGYFHRGWNNVTITQAEITSVLAGAGVTWSSLGAFRLGVYSPQGHHTTDTTYIVDSLFFGGELTRKKTPVVITIDDGAEGGADLVRIMNAYGIPTTMFIPPELMLSRPSALTGSLIPAQILDLYNAGNDVCLHSSTANEFSLDAATFLAGKGNIISAGYTRNKCHLYASYPNGTYNQAAIDLAKSMGFLGGRSIHSVVRTDATGAEAGRGGSTTTYENVLNGGLGDEFRITAEAPTTSTGALASVDSAIAHKGAYISYTHTVGDAITSIAEWTALAKGLRDRVRAGTIECMTFPVFCQTYTGRS